MAKQQVQVGDAVRDRDDHTRLGRVVRESKFGRNVFVRSALRSFWIPKHDVEVIARARK